MTVAVPSGDRIEVHLNFADEAQIPVRVAKAYYRMWFDSLIARRENEIDVAACYSFAGSRCLGILFKREVQEQTIEEICDEWCWFHYFARASYHSVSRENWLRNVQATNRSVFLFGEAKVGTNLIEEGIKSSIQYGQTQ